MLARVFFIMIGFFTMLHAEKERVTVGGYQFAPFVDVGLKGDAKGVTIDMIEALNKIQDKYDFCFFLTSPNRRYAEFEKGMFDLIFFEDIKWGWQKYPVEASDVFLKGGEVYIALKREGIEQRYFENLKYKKLVGINGYHYGFAGLNSDKEFLKKNFDIELVDKNYNTIEMVLKNRVDVAVVTLEYLRLYLKENPEAIEKLYTSEKLDQECSHTVLVRKNKKPTKEEINELLKKLQESGEMRKIFDKYGINQQ